MIKMDIRWLLIWDDEKKERGNEMMGEEKYEKQIYAQTLHFQSAG